MEVPLSRRAITARLREKLRKAASQRGYHVASASRYDLVERRFYSPVPDLGSLPPDVFDTVSDLGGLDLDTSHQIEFAECELGGYVAEFGVPPREPTGRDGEFHYANAYFEQGDAEIAYAFVRRFKPRRLIELGSGFSTLVMGMGCERNRAEGAECLYRAYDPYPRDFVAGGRVPGLTGHRALPAQEVPPAEIEALGEDDILFVDTSHTVKLGGDVNTIVLDLLPRVGPGVVVHFHDIWLPYEYHRDLVETMQMYWAEQYLLPAFLAFNDEFEVLFAAQAVARAHPARMRELIPAYAGENFPSSFWLRRRV